MKRTGVAPLFVISGILLIAAVLATLLGLDAAAEKRASADRFAVLLGTGLGSIALTLAAITFLLVELQRRLAVRRRRSMEALHEVVTELAEALAARTSEDAAPRAVPVRRAARPRARSTTRVLEGEADAPARPARPTRPRTRTRKSG